MITIDEAIALVKIEKECVQRNEAENCNRKCDECDLVQDADKILELYTQLAEWLEELKDYRDNSNGYNKEDIELNRKAMYNKAIDDLMEKISECFISDADWNYLVQVAEQLKAGGENGC